MIESRNRDKIKTKTLKLKLLNLSMNWTEIRYRIRWYVISMYYIYNNCLSNKNAFSELDSAVKRATCIIIIMYFIETKINLYD